MRILAQIARRADDESFLCEWHAASDEVELKEALLRDEAFLLLTLRHNHATADLIGRTLIETDFPEGCLVAMLRRGGRMVIPRGNTVLRENDRLTILGNNKGLRDLEARYTTNRRIDE